MLMIGLAVLSTGSLAVLPQMWVQVLYQLCKFLCALSQRGCAKGLDLAVWHHSNLRIDLLPHQRTGRASHCAECLHGYQESNRPQWHSCCVLSMQSRYYQ